MFEGAPEALLSGNQFRLISIPGDYPEHDRRSSRGDVPATPKIQNLTRFNGFPQNHCQVCRGEFMIPAGCPRQDFPGAMPRRNGTPPALKL